MVYGFFFLIKICPQSTKFRISGKIATMMKYRRPSSEILQKLSNKSLNTAEQNVYYEVCPFFIIDQQIYAIIK